MNVTFLSRPQPKNNLIGEVCDSLRTVSLTPFVVNHWATHGSMVNSTMVKGEIISDSLFACNIANDTYACLCNELDLKHRDLF